MSSATTIITTTGEKINLEGDQASVNDIAKVLTPLEAMGHRGVAVAGIPKFDNFVDQRKWQLEHLAAAFRVFGRNRYAEGIAGHISVRDPEYENRFWMNPLAIHFSMLKASDMICLDMKGNVVGGNAVSLFTLQNILQSHARGAKGTVRMEVT